MRRLAKDAWLRCRGLGRRTGGSVAVEFAILGAVFLLFIGGIVDLGHAWYMSNVMSNASREGARYATKYIPSGNSRVLPMNLNPSVRNYILNTSTANGGKGGWGLSQYLPSDAHLQVTLGGPAATETVYTNLPGEDLTVTITARKTWFLLGGLIPGLGSYKTLGVTTTMKCE
jgi:Flp pilus assembly protein TadG